jgi:hypothetical protein
MQEIRATNYAGKMVRFSADVSSQGVARWAGLWMRIDGNPQGVPTFDNMQRRPIKGTSGWARYSVILPVDSSAHSIAFGVLLNGLGSVSIRNLAFEVVPSSVAPTAEALPAVPLPLTPNLDLDKTH